MELLLVPAVELQLMVVVALAPVEALQPMAVAVDPAAAESASPSRSFKPKPGALQRAPGFIGPEFHRANVLQFTPDRKNHLKRAGYEVICLPLHNGKATGSYEDFLTGFVVDDNSVWGRPVGVAVGKDGSLFVTHDGSRSVWHVTYVGAAHK